LPKPKPVRGKTISVSGVDLGGGDGRRFRCWIRLDKHGIVIRKWHGKRRFFVPLREATELLARRGQVRLANRALGKGDHV
jgi:hypothetical protein